MKLICDTVRMVRPGKIGGFAPGAGEIALVTDFHAASGFGRAARTDVASHYTAAHSLMYVPRARTALAQLWGREHSAAETRVQSIANMMFQSRAAGKNSLVIPCASALSQGWPSLYDIFFPDYYLVEADRPYAQESRVAAHAYLCENRAPSLDYAISCLAQIVMASVVNAARLPFPNSFTVDHGVDKPEMTVQQDFWETKCRVFDGLNNRTAVQSEQYIYFDVEGTARTGVIDLSFVQRLVDEPTACVLSVGAGPAAAERCLLTLGVRPEQIHVADLEACPDVFPHRYQFDMNASWEVLGDQQFDEIWLLESFFPPRKCLHEQDPREMLDGINHILLQARQFLKPGGTLLIKTYPLLDLHDQIQMAADRVGYRLLERKHRETQFFLQRVVA